MKIKLSKIYILIKKATIIFIACGFYYNSPASAQELTGPILSNNLGTSYLPKVGHNYLICYEIQNRTHGYVEMTYGGVPIMGRGGVNGENPVTYQIWWPACGSLTAITTDRLSLVKSERFDGKLAVTIHEIERNAPTQELIGSNGIEFRALGEDRKRSYFFGKNAGKSETNHAYSNLALGNHALENVMTGNQNIAIGTRALASLTGAKSNVAMGHLALEKNTTGYNNTAIGTASLQNNTTGFDNVGLGIRSLAMTQTGKNNTGIGTDAFEENVTGSRNTGLGVYAGRLSNSSSNTVGGFASMYRYKGSLGQNTAFGVNSLGYLEDGGNNVAIGVNAGLTPINAINSTFIGLDAGHKPQQAKTTINSTALGANSWTDQDDQISLGDENVREVRTWGVIHFKKNYPVAGKDVPANSLFLGENGSLYFKNAKNKVILLADD